MQRGWDSYIVYLFDKSITSYSGPLNARRLPEKVNSIGELLFSSSILCFFVINTLLNVISEVALLTTSVTFKLSVQDSKTPLPLILLKKVWGEAVSYICGLKDDYSRLFQGQRAAM